ncbi:hypothetical protein [Roseomonas elaeocarpi]|uniref:Uncharacterized protein n=1 Tax=Roseomonas elaeocarpi TaxID=907779 RepID=A0ABV6JVR5_9PROT
MFRFRPFLLAVALGLAATGGVPAARAAEGYDSLRHFPVSRFTEGSTPRDNSNTGSSAVRGGPRYGMAVSRFTPGSTPRDNSGAGSSAVRGGPRYAMAVSRFTPGSTPTDNTDAGSSARGGFGTGPFGQGIDDVGR